MLLSAFGVVDETNESVSTVDSQQLSLPSELFEAFHMFSKATSGERGVPTSPKPAVSRRTARLSVSPPIEKLASPSELASSTASSSNANIAEFLADSTPSSAFHLGDIRKAYDVESLLPCLTFFVYLLSFCYRFEKRIETLEEQISATRHEKMLLNLELVKLKEEAREEVQFTRLEAESALREADDEIETLKSNIATLEKKLEANKTDFLDIHDLSLFSSTELESLRALPPSSLSLRQFILLKMGEGTKQLRQRIEQLESKCEAETQAKEEALTNLVRTKEELIQKSTMLESSESLKNRSEDYWKDKLQFSDSKVAELTETVNILQSKLDSLSDMESKRVELITRATLAEKERDKEIVLRNDLRILLEEAREQYDIAQERLENLQKQVEVLSLERNMAIARAEEAKRISDATSDALTAAQESLRELREEKNEIQKQLTLYIGEGRGAFEQRLEAEISRLREERGIELDRMKLQQSEVLLRELRNSEDRRIAMEEEIAMLRQKLLSYESTKRRESETEARNTLDYSVRAAELEVKLKAKEQELARQSVLLADVQKRLSETRKELEEYQRRSMQWELKFGQGEAKYKSTTTILKDKIASLEERVGTYEALLGFGKLSLVNLETSPRAKKVEGDDFGISTVGENEERRDTHDSGMLVGGNTSGGLEELPSSLRGSKVASTFDDSDLPSVLAQLPQSSPPILLTMAMELFEYKSKKQRLEGKLEQLNETLSIAQKELDENRQTLDSISGPPAYFVDRLKDAQKREATLRLQYHRVCNELKEMESRFVRTTVQKEEREQELVALKAQLASLERELSSRQATSQFPPAPPVPATSIASVTPLPLPSASTIAPSELPRTKPIPMAYVQATQIAQSTFPNAHVNTYPAPKSTSRISDPLTQTGDPVAPSIVVRPLVRITGETQLPKWVQSSLVLKQ